MALGLSGRAKGSVWRNFQYKPHPTPRGRPLRGAKCILIPLGAPDLPLTLLSAAGASEVLGCWVRLARIETIRIDRVAKCFQLGLQNASVPSRKTNP